MKRLVVNADDFGIAPGVNRGIVQALLAGVVTSTSCLVYGDMPALPPELHGRVGIHLRLTDGKPLSDPTRIGSLIGSNGRFPASREAVRLMAVDSDEVRREWTAQIEMFLRSGFAPTHIDTHHHSHSLPGIAEVYADLASLYSVAALGLDGGGIRDLRSAGVRCPDFAEITWNVFGPVNVLDLAGAAFAAGHETVFLMTHPGYVDDSLIQRSSMVQARRAELDVLLSPRFREAVADDGISLIGMGDL